MPNDDSIQIYKAVIHKVDHITASNPILSGVETTLNDEIRKFISQHIRKSKDHKFTRGAVFNKSPNEPPPGFISFQKEVDTILCDPHNPEVFISHSKTLAESLFETVKGDQRISKSDLIMCTFSDTDRGDVQLAILKMDPHNGFVTRETQDKNGVAFIELVAVPSVISDRELQKCAFVLPVSQRGVRGCDLRVLDFQRQSRGYENQVSTFFITDFLQCSVNLDSDDKTDLFLRESYAFAARRRDEWDESEIEGFKNAANQAVSRNRLDVTAFAEEYITDASERENYVNHLEHKGLEDLTFTPSAERASQYNNVALFKGDDGIELKLPSEMIMQNTDFEFYQSASTAMDTPLSQLLAENSDKRVVVLHDENETVIVIKTIHFERKLSKQRLPKKTS
jgi:hypothetical protein